MSEDQLSVFSRTLYIITYAGCPGSLISKLQTEINISSTEVEYIALVLSIRESILMIVLLEELKQILPIQTEIHKVHCTILEDNH